jgi:hypothetical protein
MIVTMRKRIILAAVLSFATFGLPYNGARTR